MKPLNNQQREAFVRDGFFLAPGLLSQELVQSTKENLLTQLHIDPQDSSTWSGKSVSDDVKALALTEPCRTPAIENIALQLVGPNFSPSVCYSPFLESKGNPSPLRKGYIPVLNFPVPGPRQFQPPGSYHIDGMHLTSTWPTKFFLVVFAYLSDTTEYGGATTVLPGSHRQVFEHWISTENKGNTVPPQLSYAAPLPVAGNAGDVIFMHYLLVHSGSTNHSDHIRVGLNTAVMPSPEHPYQRKIGVPQPDWTPLDWTLRTDTIGCFA